MRIKAALERYLATNMRVTSKSTLKHYHVTLEQYQRVAGKNLRHLSDENLARFMRWLGDNGRAPATVNQKRNYVCAFWRWCAKKNLVRRWPTVAPVKEPERIPEAWTMNQLSQLFSACKCQTGYLSGVPASRWWHSLHLWWYYTGERVCASLAARWTNYDGTQILIPAEARKGGCKTMVYQLVPDLRVAIERIRRPERELIWPWEKHIASFYNAYHRLLRDADLPYQRWKSGPQKMRRSYASHLEAAGGDATLGLRHSKSSITRDSYLDPRIATAKNQSELLPKVG